jgi:5'-nucleotidase / UDP-sugar diphosphatase
LGRIRPLILAIVLALAALAADERGFAQQDEPGSPRSRAAVTFLQINDVYSTLPIDDAGGLARVATLKQRIRASGRTPVLVLAGDFLSPSVASSVFKGEQMVAALNAAGLDVATLGNHEFDFGDEVLIERMKAGRWLWLVANVVDRLTGKPIGGASPYVVRTYNGMKVGLIGLCLTTTEISRDKLTHTRLLDPFVTAAQYIPLLKRQGAQAIVAVTHLTFADDRRLVRRFPDIDLVIGGHEHYPITAVEGRSLVSKAGSDARWVARIDLAAPPAGPLLRFFELIPIGGGIPDDPATAAVVHDYEARLGTELDAVVGETTVPLDAQSVRLRASEQPLGDLFADALREDVKADAALVNAGSIRGDRVYPAGPITLRTLVAMHPFGNVVCKIEVSGAVLLQALNSGVSRLPASAGQFPQVSGMTFTVDVSQPPGSRVHDVVVDGKPVEPTGRYTLAVPDYILKGGDGYSMLPGQRVLVNPEAGNLIVTAVQRYVAARRMISPANAGRIRIVNLP